MKKTQNSKKTSILIIDDDRHLLQSMGGWMSEQGFEVDLACDFQTTKEKLVQSEFELALLDLKLGMDDGFEVLEFCRVHYPNLIVLLMTGYATVDTGIEAVRAGAFDLLTKPLIDEEILIAIDRALSQHEVIEENNKLKAELDNRFGMENIVASDTRMQKLFDVVDSIANTKATVLVTGESGTGKSLLARAIHRRSDRREAPFIEVACGALPENLLESELFGHVVGAFTGATTNKEGKFKQADGGTIFLDEIGTASPAMQVKLLRVLQELEFEQVGGSETFCVNTRIILATNEDLEKAVEKGTFRQDLFYRVNVINLELPSLSQRVSDIPVLAEHFLLKVCSETGKTVQGFEADAMSALQNYDWPGNVRELQNIIERAVLLGKSDTILLSDLPTHISSNTMCTPSPTRSPLAGQPQTLKEALEGPERQIILQVLRQNNWNRNETADQLGVNRTTLYKKMKKLGLDNPQMSPSNPI